MDKETRKKLKNAGKAEVERQSAELHARLKECNPVDVSDPQWAENYREITAKEKNYKVNRTEIYPASYVGTELLLNPVKIDWSRGYLPVQGYYLQCKSCGDLIPMNPEIDLECRCKAVSISPGGRRVLFEPRMVQVTKLIAKASQIQGGSKKWWKVWLLRLTSSSKGLF